MTKTISIRLLASVLVVAASLAFFAIAHAEDGRGEKMEVEVKASIKTTTEVHSEDSERDENKKDEQEKSDTMSNRNDDGDEHESAMQDASSTVSVSTSTDDDNGHDDKSDKGEDHRSEIADIVHKLQEIADKDRGIGDDVREVAMAQASTSIEVSQRMRALESESKIKTFFFGSDQGSVGALRSSLETTQNHIDRLQKVAEKVTDPQVKAELSVEIAALQNTASSTRTFIVQHEQVFSLFGWFLKIIGN